MTNNKLKRYLTQTLLNLTDEIEKLHDKIYLIDFHPEYALKIMRNELTARISTCQKRMQEIEKTYKLLKEEK